MHFLTTTQIKRLQKSFRKLKKTTINMNECCEKNGFESTRNLLGDGLGQVLARLRLASTSRPLWSTTEVQFQRTHQSATQFQSVHSTTSVPLVTDTCHHCHCTMQRKQQLIGTHRSRWVKQLPCIPWDSTWSYRRIDNDIIGLLFLLLSLK